MVIVDTGAWVELLRKQGDQAIRAAVVGLIGQFEATLCGPVEMELLGGTRPHERLRLQSWLNVLPYARSDHKLWRAAGAHYHNLRSQGLTLPWNDVLIASVALAHQCRIYAPDPHFEAMAPVLGLALYQPGYGGMFTPENE